MLNTFPQFFTFSLFAPTLLRIVAAVVFANLAYLHFKHRKQIATTGFPIIGKKTWVAWVAIVVESVVALGLFLGYYSQISAILGTLLAIKYAFWSGRYETFFILPRSTALLLAAICLSLVVTGAGLVAFDIPGL